MEPPESMLARFAPREHTCRSLVTKSADAAGRTSRIALVVIGAGAGRTSRIGESIAPRQDSHSGSETKH